MKNSSKTLALGQRQTPPLSQWCMRSSSCQSRDCTCARCRDPSRKAQESEESEHPPDPEWLSTTSLVLAQGVSDSPRKGLDQIGCTRGLTSTDACEPVTSL